MNKTLPCLLTCVLLATGCGLGPIRPYGSRPPEVAVAPVGSAAALKSRGTLLVLGCFDDESIQPMGVDYYGPEAALRRTHALYGVAPALRDSLHQALRASGVRVIKDSLDQGLADPYPNLRVSGRARVLRVRLMRLNLERHQGKPVRASIALLLELHDPQATKSCWAAAIDMSLADTSEAPFGDDPLLVLGAQVGARLLSDESFRKELQ